MHILDKGKLDNVAKKVVTRNHPLSSQMAIADFKAVK